MATATDKPNPGLAPLVDSHAHLDSEDYDGDREAVVRRAWEFGLVAIVTIGIEPGDWDKTLRIAGEHGGVYPALAVHPNSAGQANDETLARLRTLCKEHKAVAVGETGLDYYREYVPHEKQRESFRAHLALARELDLPVIIHNRDAGQDVLKVLREDGRGTRGVMHSFSGDVAYAKECIELGYMISLAGPVSFRKATDKHSVAREVPLDRLLVETDCPFLTPEPFRGRRNEPAYVAYTARAIADLRGVPLEAVATATTENAMKLFGLHRAQATRDS
ncbi:MAG: TatD family hydrolase [Chloroflexia bacterium]